MSVKEYVTEKLTKAFEPIFLEVEVEETSCGAKINVILASPKFEGGPHVP